MQKMGMRRKQGPLPESELRVLYARPDALDRGKFRGKSEFVARARKDTRHV
jgi:hypothetical protein